MPENPNDASSIGQDKQYKDYTEKYDADHGKYTGNVQRDGGAPNLPNASPAAADPKPYKVGQ
jgi:hypothetical protein